MVPDTMPSTNRTPPPRYGPVTAAGRGDPSEPAGSVHRLSQPPVQHLARSWLLERYLPSHCHHATGNAGLGPGDGEPARCPVQLNGKIGELGLLAQAQCPVCDRHSHLPVKPGNHRASRRTPADVLRPQRLEHRRLISLSILTSVQVDVDISHTHGERFGRKQEGDDGKVDGEMLDPH